MPEPKDEFDSEWFNFQMKELQELKKEVDEFAKSKKEDIDFARRYWDNKIEGLQYQINQIKDQLGDFLNRYGMTSYSTAFGNAHLRTAGDKFDWKTLSANDKREIAKHLPEELVDRKPKEGAVNKASQILDDGRVVLTETGEIIPGLTGKKGGYKTVTIRERGI